MSIIMESMGRKRWRPRRAFHAGVQGRDRRVVSARGPYGRAGSKDFDLTETAVRLWVKQAEIDGGTRSDGLTSNEREELARLRRENRQLREDVDILKRATLGSTRQRNTGMIRCCSGRGLRVGAVGASGSVGGAEA